MTDLITVEQLEARLATAFTGTDLAQAEAYITDASEIVIHVAGTSFPAGVPGVIVGVVAQMIRRGLENPGELTGEQVGAYGWQNQHAGSSAGAALYVTRAERKLIREAAGRPAVVTISGDTGLGIGGSFYGVDIDDVPL